ncbi:vacuolar protein sorting-associated protein 26B-like isoform X2 [Convolutriloba macropyga]|uniref:vacuolar protein sorting-associated protein 26B-like isoform X2 n=1 Tax=Convolutriloba macropyga TaxID=536237 RepID=UPI003F51F673
MDWLTGANSQIDIILNNLEGKPEAETRADDTSGNKVRLPVFLDGETISGAVNINLKNNKKLEHNGIKVEFIGDIQLFFDKNSTHEFLSIVKQLARPGELTRSSTFKFEFPNTEKPYETYAGQNVRLRYYLRVTVNRKYKLSPTKEYPILVHALSYFPERVPQTLKMEVGIEDALHIEFEFNKAKYHLKDVIVGKIYFILVRLKLRVMELQLLRKEVTGQGTTRVEEEEVVVKYELMDGSPVKGETIPIRLFLIALGLTPTFRDICKKFSVSYYINLVLIDEDERRYFKQQEITLYRKTDKQFSHLTTFSEQPQAYNQHVASMSHSPQPYLPTSASGNSLDPNQQQAQHNPNSSASYLPSYQSNGSVGGNTPSIPDYSSPPPSYDSIAGPDAGEKNAIPNGNSSVTKKGDDGDL